MRQALPVLACPDVHVPGGSSVTLGVLAWLPAEGGQWSVLELEGLW